MISGARPSRSSPQAKPIKPADEAPAPPDVSVVVSTFDRADLLPSAVEHLVRQHTSRRYEVVIVDNNSTDRTPAVLAELAHRYGGLLRHGFERRQGVSHGRNKGIELSRAPVVAFTDDDVLVTSDWVERIGSALSTHPEVDCVGGRVLPVWTVPPPAWVTPSHWSPLALVDYGDEPFYIDRGRPLCLVTSNVAYRRAALDAIGWFSPDFPRCQDHELLLRLWQAGSRGLYLPDLVVRCEVPAARLQWSYHRRWHSEHGRFSALMHEDQVSALDPTAPQVRPATLFGSPAAVYRELVASATRFLAARLTRRSDAAHEAEAVLRHRAAFIMTRARAWRRGKRGALQEVVRFALVWPANRRRRDGRGSGGDADSRRWRSASGSRRHRP